MLYKEALRTGLYCYTEHSSGDPAAELLMVFTNEHWLLERLMPTVPSSLIWNSKKSTVLPLHTNAGTIRLEVSRSNGRLKINFMLRSDRMQCTSDCYRDGYRNWVSIWPTSQAILGIKMLRTRSRHRWRALSSLQINAEKTLTSFSIDPNSKRPSRATALFVYHNGHLLTIINRPIVRHHIPVNIMPKTMDYTLIYNVPREATCCHMIPA